MTCMTHTRVLLFAVDALCLCRWRLFLISPAGSQCLVQRMPVRDQQQGWRQVRQLQHLIDLLLELMFTEITACSGLCKVLVCGLSSSFKHICCLQSCISTVCTGSNTQCAQFCQQLQSAYCMCCYNVLMPYATVITVNECSLQHCRVYSLRNLGPNQDLTLDMGAYRYMPLAQPLITDIIQNLLQLPNRLYQVTKAADHSDACALRPESMHHQRPEAFQHRSI